MSDLGKFVRKLDLFRKIDEGYLQTSTAHGGTFSLIAYIIMIALAVFEFSEYMSSHPSSTLAMDDNWDKDLMIQFDITMLDLPCKYTAIDVYDIFDWERQNITKDITKTRLHLVDGKLFEGDDHEDEEDDGPSTDPKEEHAEIEVDEEGHHALDLLGEEGFDSELRTHDYTLMNFYAPWCHWCKALAPTYEKAADEFDKIRFSHKSIRAKFASINCEKYSQICRKFKIRAYPTLLIFNRDKPIYPTYSGERTVNGLVAYLKDAVLAAETHMPNTFHDQACRIKGDIFVPRVPGNFHIEARSSSHDISPSMANVSHIVHHLQFGDSINREMLKKLPSKHKFLMHPIDGRRFLLDKMHTAPQHFIKIVYTEFHLTYDFMVRSYQLTTQNRIASFDEEDVPQAKFHYELSPVMVMVDQKGKPFYSFLTSLFAIIGGTFTVISLLDGAVETVNVRLKKTLGKFN